MCFGNTKCRCEGTDIMELVRHTHKPIKWCDNHTKLCKIHIVSNKLTLANVKYEKFDVLLKTTNCDFLTDIWFGKAVWPRLERKLENLLKKMISDGLCKMKGDEMMFQPWVTNRFLADDWNGDDQPQPDNELFSRG